MEDLEKKINYQCVLEHFETLDLYYYHTKKFLVTEIERIVAKIADFDKEIVFSEPIKEYDKIRMSSMAATLHYNGENGGEGWIELDVFFDISVIIDILSELRIYAVENM